MFSMFLIQLMKPFTFQEHIFMLFACLAPSLSPLSGARETPIGKCTFSLALWSWSSVEIKLARTRFINCLFARHKSCLFPFYCLKCVNCSIVGFRMRKVSINCISCTVLLNYNFSCRLCPGYDLFIFLFHMSILSGIIFKSPIHNIYFWAPDWFSCNSSLKTRLIAGSHSLHRI